MTGDFFLTQWFFLAMRWLCENVVANDVFLTILISTLVLRLLTLFSDIKQRKFSQKNAAMQPELQKLQQRCKDPKQLQSEQQKLMKKYGVNMLDGCLPMLITLPLLFCFIAAFRFWGYEQNVKMINEMSENIAYSMREEGLVSSDANTVDCINTLLDMSEDKQKEFFENSDIEVSKTFLQSKFLWINNIWQPDNGFSPVVTESKTFFGANYSSTKKLIYLSEHKDVKNKMIDLGILYDLSDGYKDKSKNEQKELKEKAISTYNILMTPLEKVYEGHNNGWFILPVLATLFQLLYMLYTQKHTAAKTNGSDNASAASSKFMMYLMPAMSFVFCLSYTSSFAMYWTLMLIINIILTKIFDNKTAVK